MTTDSALDDEFEATLIATTDDKPSCAIWHYGTAHGIGCIVSSKKMWATHYGYTNDPREIRIGERAVGAVIDAMASTGTLEAQQVFQALAKRYKEEALTQIADVYIACFTEDLEYPGDELTQWRGYGDAGTGYSLGLFPAPVATSATAPKDSTLGTYLVQVQYDIGPFQAKVRACLERLLGVHNEQERNGTAKLSRTVTWMIREAVAFVPRLKHEFFKAEREWRYVVVPFGPPSESYRRDVQFRPSPNGLVPYVELPLTSPDEQLPIAGIVAGPGRRGRQRAAAAGMLLAQNKYDSNLARISRGALVE